MPSKPPAPSSTHKAAMKPEQNDGSPKATAEKNIHPFPPREDDSTPKDKSPGDAARTEGHAMGNKPKDATEPVTEPQSASPHSGVSRFVGAFKRPFNLVALTQAAFQMVAGNGQNDAYASGVPTFSLLGELNLPHTSLEWNPSRHGNGAQPDSLPRGAASPVAASNYRTECANEGQGAQNTSAAPTTNGATLKPGLGAQENTSVPHERHPAHPELAAPSKSTASTADQPSQGRKGSHAPTPASLKTSRTSLRMPESSTGDLDSANARGGVAEPEDTHESQRSSPPTASRDNTKERPGSAEARKQRTDRRDGRSGNANKEKPLPSPPPPEGNAVRTPSIADKEEVVVESGPHAPLGPEDKSEKPTATEITTSPVIASAEATSVGSRREVDAPVGSGTGSTDVMAIVSVQGVTNDGVASARAETVASSPVGSSTAMATEMVAAVGQDVAVHLSSDTGAADNLSTPGPDTASEEVMVGQVEASDGPWDKMGEEFGVGKPLDDATALIKRGLQGVGDVHYKTLKFSVFPEIRDADPSGEHSRMRNLNDPDDLFRFLMQNRVFRPASEPKRSIKRCTNFSDLLEGEDHLSSILVELGIDRRLNDLQRQLEDPGETPHESHPFAGWGDIRPREISILDIAYARSAETTKLQYTRLKIKADVLPGSLEDKSMGQRLLGAKMSVNIFAEVVTREFCLRDQDDAHGPKFTGHVSGRQKGRGILAALRRAFKFPDSTVRAPRSRHLET